MADKKWFVGQLNTGSWVALDGVVDDEYEQSDFLFSTKVKASSRQDAISKGVMQKTQARLKSRLIPDY
jgi:hypothetical protein